MKCQSVSTTNIDPYEAGLEIGQALHDVQPEAILLFTSVHYADFSELYEGLYDGLETKDVIVLGGTGDGFYESNNVADIGIGAMGINSEGKTTWHLAIEEDLTADSFLAGQKCAQRIAEAAGEDLKLSFVIAGMSIDGTQLVAGINSRLKTPCIGGLSGDDRQYQQGIVLANGKVYENAVALLGCAGELSFDLNVASGWKPIGEIAIVEETDGTSINRIGDQTTLQFVTQQFGKTPTSADLGVVTLGAYQEEGSQLLSQRSPYQIDEEKGAITYFASVEPGTPVQVCLASKEDVVGGVKEAIAGVSNIDFEPKAGIIISCAGRKWVLGKETEKEVHNLSKKLPNDFPLVGLPTFGEIAPLKNADGSFTETFFHNVTYAILLLG